MLLLGRYILLSYLGTPNYISILILRFKLKVIKGDRKGKRLGGGAQFFHSPYLPWVDLVKVKSTDVIDYIAHDLQQMIESINFLKQVAVLAVIALI
jgi:hypothetical protein